MLLSHTLPLGKKLSEVNYMMCIVIYGWKHYNYLHLSINSIYCTKWKMVHGYLSSYSTKSHENLKEGPNMAILVKVAESLDEFKLALQIRRQVFVEEHRVPEEIEADQYDHVAVHFLAWDGKYVIGTGLVVLLDLEPLTAKVERVAVQKEYRHSGSREENYGGDGTICPGKKEPKRFGSSLPIGSGSIYAKIGYQTVDAPF